MFVYVKLDTTLNNVVKIEIHSTEIYSGNSNWIKLDDTRINQQTSEIALSDDTRVSLKTFIESMRVFTVNASGVVSRTNVDDSVSIDTTIPLAFTRANTVVNFGRL